MIKKSPVPTIFIILVMILLIVYFPTKQKHLYGWLNSLPKPWILNTKDISKILPQFHYRFPDFHERLKAFAIWRVGTPYEIFKLGEEVEPDLDPIIRLDVSDCTAHVLTTLAFVQSSSWEESRKNMIVIHYKPNLYGHKIPTFKTRWHYTLDRITANQYTVNITEQLLPLEKLVEKKLILNRQEDESEFLNLGWEREITFRYIPNSEINNNLLSKIPDVCGVAFVKKAYFNKGIAIGHEGMIINQKDLIHASSTVGKTVRLNFLDYYFRDSGPIFNGIMIYNYFPISASTP